MPTRARTYLHPHFSVAILLAATPVARAVSYSSTVLFPLSIGSAYAGPYPSTSTQSADEGEVAGCGQLATSGNYQAFVWSAGTGSGIDLGTNIPANAVKSFAVGTDGVNQVGFSEGSSGAYSDQALLWSGSAGSMVNLNPTLLPGITISEAFAVGGNQQVGYGEGSGSGLNSHAMVWTGTAASAVDLNPAAMGITSSIARGTDGSQQVGDGLGTVTGGDPQAFMWSSNAQSAVNLNPSQLGMVVSQAYGISGNQQVGEGSGAGTSYNAHALLWNGSAGSAVDLNPTNLAGFSSSQADATNGSQQVGFGFGTSTGNNDHALLWSGSANSAVDLQSLLPASGSRNTSRASSIDSAGNVFGIAQGTYNGSSGYFAVEWSPYIFSPGIDLAANALDFANGSLGNLTLQLRHGYDNGAWNGPDGIYSSAAAADTTHLTALGILQNNLSGVPLYTFFEGAAVGLNDILIKYTYYGDTNLDGTVDGSDYSRIDAGYLSKGALTGWFNGDFNYDGVVNGSDYTLIDNAFNQQGAQLTAAIAAPTTQIAGTAVVPEPTAAGLLGIGTLGVLRRRRRVSTR